MLKFIIVPIKIITFVLNLFGNAKYKIQTYLLLIVCNTALIMSLFTGTIHAQNAPPIHWYNGYWADKNIDGTPVTQALSGEDWFYDFCQSIDPETKKAEGFICTGYQRSSCGSSMPSYNPIGGCQVDYALLRDNVMSVPPNRNTTLWFIDLCGNKKWAIDITYLGNVAHEARSVIQTSDGNYVVAGGIYVKNTPGAYAINPGTNQYAMPSIIDLTGKVLYTQNVLSGTVANNVNVINTTGVYIVRIKTKATVVNIKINKL